MPLVTRYIPGKGFQGDIIILALSSVSEMT